MNALLHWFTSPEWAQVVKALLHSLWQGALIAAGLALLLRRVTNPEVRYRLTLAALVATLLASVVTWGVLNVPKNPAADIALPIATKIEQPPAVGPVEKIVVTANWTPGKQTMQWTAWLALAWLLGASAMLGRASVKVAGAEQLRRSCQTLNDPRIAGLVAEARRAVKLTRQVRVAVTDQLTSPAVVGVLVPTLILPLSLITTLTPEQIRFVLLHELAHIRRGDYLANLFQLFAEALLFFNPAVWWLSHQIRREREACCDALAIELSGAPADYARTLVSVAETMLNPSPAAAPAFGNEREPSSLSDRVQRVLVPGYRPSLRLTWRAMLAALVAGSVLLGLLAAGTRETVAATAALLAPEKQAESAVTGEGAPVLQLRLIQDEATPDTETMISSTTNTGSGMVFTENLHMQKKVLLDQSAIKSASVEMSSRPGQPDFPSVNFSLTPEGTKQFAKITRENIGRRLAIIVAGKVVSAPFIRSEISGGSGQISGNFTVEEARRMAAIISGATIPEPPGIKVKTSGISISSESATYNPTEKAMTARGNVEITTANGMKITTEEARIQLGTSNAAIGANTPLYTRTFKVDTNEFARALGMVGPVASTNFAESLRVFMAQIDVDWQPPKTMFYSHGKGTLYVRATLQDLDIIEQALQVISIKPPQVNLRARIVEVPEEQAAGFFAGVKTSTNREGQITGTLTAAEAKQFFKSLEQKPGVSIISAPNVTTLSGRQAQVQMMPDESFMTKQLTIITSGISPNMSSPVLGPTLDMIPYVSADGVSVQLVVIPTITEFLGYDDPGAFIPSNGKPLGTVLPLPHFRVKQITTTATPTVLDGQTLMLGSVVSQPPKSKDKVPVLGDLPFVGRKHNIFIFITPTIIDPAGNRVHTDEEISSTREVVPKPKPVFPGTPR